MYTYEERKNAVELLIKYDMQYAYTIRKLGYPNSETSLKNRYTEYIKNGDLKMNALLNKSGEIYLMISTSKGAIF